MREALVTLVFAAGCGRVSFDELPAAADGAADGPAIDGTATTYPEAIKADGPIAYYRLADTGAIAVDEIGVYPGSYTGACSHGVTGALAGDSNTALGLDGASCQILLGDVLAFSDLRPFSIELWVRENVTSSYQIFIMRETRNGENPMDGYAMLNSPSGMYLERCVATTCEVTSPIGIPVGPYMHLVGTFDGAALHMYIDGVEAVPAKPTNMIVPTFSATTSIGSFPPPGEDWVDGDLDEFAIYDHALTLERIAKHHELGVIER